MALAFLKPWEPPPVSVKALIHNKLAGKEDVFPHFPLRASMLLKPGKEFCPREHALLDLGKGKVAANFVSTAMRITFDHGKDTEERIRNIYLRDIVVGRWRCGICGFKTAAFSKAPKIKCPKCGWGSQWRYIEPEFQDPHTGVVGHFDLLLDVDRPKLRVVELKTMAPDDFKTLVAPLAEHRFRTVLYLHLAEKSPSLPASQIDTSEANILYASKSFGVKDNSLKSLGVNGDFPFSPFKEYRVKPNVQLIATPLSKARVLKVWRDNKSLGMPGGICPNAMVKRAQVCSACAACWSGKFPSTLTWLDNGALRHPGKKLID